MVDADHFTCKAAVDQSGSELAAFRHATFLNHGDSAAPARFKPRKCTQPNGSGAERSGSQNIPTP
nr:G321 [uncultured bacterium]